MAILPKIEFKDYSNEVIKDNKNTNGKTFLIDFQKKKMLKNLKSIKKLKRIK